MEREISWSELIIEELDGLIGEVIIDGDKKKVIVKED